MLQGILALASGGGVGLILGLVGGGGSIIAVPLLIYVVGMTSPHAAIGTGAVAVTLSALANLAAQVRRGMVKWRCAMVFSASGIIGAALGSSVAKTFDGGKLLALFGLLMIAVGTLMAIRRDVDGNASVRLTRESARELLPLLIAIGAGVGLLSGFFGIGGGFLIVPGLMLATGMPLPYAASTSLVAVTAFGATTAANYALSGFVDWRITTFFVAGGLFGGIGGTILGSKLSHERGRLALVFAMIVVATGVFVTTKGYSALMS
jgi:uncharacterized membrane protein YfcA